MKEEPKQAVTFGMALYLFGVACILAACLCAASARTAL